MKLLFLILSLFFTINIFSQETSINFEGKISYILQSLNPNPGLISDDEYYESLPNEGKSIVTFYVKGNQFKWDYENRIEVFLPERNQIAIWSKSSQDSIYYAYANLSEEPLEKIEKSTKTKTVLKYNLLAIDAKSKWESKTFFYSPTELKTNPNNWKNIHRDFFGDCIAKSSSFPMMIYSKSLLGNWIMAMTSFELLKLDDKEFHLPEKR